MLRSLFRSPRRIRLPLQNGTVDLQRVAITRSSKTTPVAYRLFTTFAVSYFLTSTFHRLYPDWYDSAEARARNAQKSDGAKSLGNGGEKSSTATSQTEAEVIHLMLPIWIRQKEPQPWQPDDPTWKSFQALANDEKRWKDVVASLKKPIIKEVLNRYQSSLVAVGGPHVNGKRSLFYHHSWRMAPPLHAPAAYEVPCVFVEPDQTTFGWREVPNAMGMKLDRVFHPIVLTTAFFNGFREFYRASYLITKARLTEQYESLSASKQSKGSSKQAFTEKEIISKQLAIGRVSEKDKEMFLPFLRGEFGEHEARKGYRDFVKTMTYTAAIESGCAVFRAHWYRGQLRASQQASSRDSVMLMGNIGFIGERGTIHLSAVVLYSPETNSIIGSPIINHAYITPKMDKWVEDKNQKKIVKTIQPATDTTAEKAPVPEDLKQASPGQQDDLPNGGKSVTEANSESNSDK